MQEIWSTAEVARALGVTPSTVSRWANDPAENFTPHVRGEGLRGGMWFKLSAVIDLASTKKKILKNPHELDESPSDSYEAPGEHDGPSDSYEAPSEG